MGNIELPVAEIVRPFEVETPGREVDPLPAAVTLTDIEDGRDLDIWNPEPDMDLAECSQAAVVCLCVCAGLALLLLIVFAPLP